MLDLTTTKYTERDIQAKRKGVYAALCRASDNIKGGNIRIISQADLELLLGLYDHVFLKDWFKKNFKGHFKFSLSRRMTKSAGKTICPRNIAGIKPEDLVLEIRISVELLFKYSALEGPKSVGGIKTKDSIEALQLIFEHELCHAIELIYFKESNCSKDRFKSLARNLFGHSESHHQLPTTRLINHRKYGFKVGDRVAFTCDSCKYNGVISRINKNATVMVEDNKGDYVDQKGKKYTKYYVPLGLLENRS